MTPNSKVKEEEVVPDAFKKLLVPSQLDPTTKARKKVIEMYANYPGVDRDDVEEFAQGHVDFFLIMTKNRPIKFTWEVFYSCLSYQEIWELVSDEFRKTDEFDWLEKEFDDL